MDHCGSYGVNKMTEQAVIRPLPKTVADLIAGRKGKFERTLNDHVEEVYLRLWENPEFKKLLEGTVDSDCVEGSETCDDHEAAKMIRDYFGESGSPLASKNIHTLKLSLRVIMRRYSTSRKERRDALRGIRVAE